MEGWDQLSPFALPAGLGDPRRAQVVGRDELGRPILRGADGQTYSLPMPERTAPRNNALAGLAELAFAGIGRLPNALAEAVWQGVSAPGRAASGEPVTLGDAWATALDWGAMGSAAGVPAEALAANSFRAYHGSPHRFDRFSLDRIGTGEGAQAYGHGLYFADSEDVARGYRDALSPGRGTGAVDTAARILRDHGGDYGAALDEATARFNRALAARRMPNEDYDRWMEVRRLLANEAPVGGHLYEVQINADPDTFLNWDAPLEAQSRPVREALAAGPEGGWRGEGIDLDRDGDIQAKLLYLAFGDPPSASATLAERGVPGIRYYDAGSRGAGTGTRNTVLFDDSLVEILRRYGIAGLAPSAALATAAAQQGYDLSPPDPDLNALAAYLGGA